MDDADTQFAVNTFIFLRQILCAYGIYPAAVRAVSCVHYTNNDNEVLYYTF